MKNRTRRKNLQQDLQIKQTPINKKTVYKTHFALRCTQAWLFHKEYSSELSLSRSLYLLYEVPHWLCVSKFTQLPSLRAVSWRQHGSWWKDKRL